MVVVGPGRCLMLHFVRTLPSDHVLSMQTEFRLFHRRTPSCYDLGSTIRMGFPSEAHRSLATLTLALSIPTT
jgi:hypothetical protein